MSEWSDAETRELVSLWPTASAAQIAKRLHRPIGAITSKATRLRQEGLLPAGVAKHFAVNPWWVRQVRPPKPISFHDRKKLGARRAEFQRSPPVDDTLDMRPCALIELDDCRCHWPLGDIEAVAVMFCGSAAVPGRCYCAHHLRRARGQGSAS